MSNNGRLRTIRVPLRKLCSAIPAVAMISGGIVFSASAAPTAGIHGDAVSIGSPAILVPDVALTWPPSTGPAADASRLVGPRPENPAPAAKPLAPVVSEGTKPGSTALVTLDSTGIPVRALEGYRQAATLTDSADPTCNIDWALLAAIGRVESNHARFGGNQLDLGGVARPGIIGIPLDGSNGTALITDTDGGLLDRDTVYDRAVGPMQFIPGTWRISGVDADGDGVKNPQDIADASTSSAVYLCSGPGDLRRPDALRSAILRYNASDSYVQMVTNIASAYRNGVRALPASDLAPATPTTPAKSTSQAATSRSLRAVQGSPVKPEPTTAAPTTAASVKPAPTTAAPTTAAPTTAVPTTTAAPTTAVPTTAVPTTTAAPTTAVPTTTVPTTAVPTTAVPTTTAAPTTAAPCVSITDPGLPTATATATPSSEPVPCPTTTVATSPPATTSTP